MPSRLSASIYVSFEFHLRLAVWRNIRFRASRLVQAMFKIRSFIEPVSRAAYADDVCRVLRIAFDLGPKMIHVRVDHAIREKHILAPAFLQQSIERKHFAAVFNEDSKKFEFSRCQIDDAAGAPDFVTSEIHLNVSELKRLSHRWTRRAAKHRLNPRDEFPRT